VTFIPGISDFPLAKRAVSAGRRALTDAVSKGKLDKGVVAPKTTDVCLVVKRTDFGEK
jgi:hypothetical protein